MGHQERRHTTTPISRDEVDVQASHRAFSSRELAPEPMGAAVKQEVHKVTPAAAQRSHVLSLWKDRTHCPQVPIQGYYMQPVRKEGTLESCLSK